MSNLGPTVLPLLAIIGGTVALVLVLADLRRAPQRGHGWFAAAIVPLVAAAVPFEPFGFDYAAQDNAWPWRIPIALVILLPAILLHLVAALSGIRASRLVRACDVLTAGLVTWVLLMPRFPGPGATDLPWWFELAFAAYALQFALAVVIAVRMLARATRGSTGAARMRGRLLAATLGTFGVAYLVWFVAPTPTLETVMSWISLATGAFLWLAIRGPRTAWQLVVARTASGRDPYRALEGLIASPDVRDGLPAVLEAVVRDWGLVGLAAIDVDGRPIELTGASPVRSTAARDAHALDVHPTGANVGMRAWATPLTPPLRRGDLERLQMLGHLIRVALVREETARDRSAVERASRDVDERLEHVEEQLRIAHELRDRAYPIVTDDLRGPVTALLGLTDALDTRWHELPADQLEPLQQLVARQVGRLAAVVDKLLVVTAIEQGALRSTPEPVDVRELVTSVVDGQLDADVRFSCAESDTCCRVHVEPLALREILTQLLDNARSHGAPDVEVRIGPTDGDILIEVLDEGRGVRADFEHRLFERFTRDSPKTERGLGLGLAIARELAHSLGGSIGYRRDDEDRTVFWLRLPAAATST